MPDGTTPAPPPTHAAAPISQFEWAAVGAVLCCFVAIVVAGILRRSFELDEGYTLLLLTGHPQVVWPPGVFHRDDIAAWFDAHGHVGTILRDLRRTDVHPPLWFLVMEGWRRLVGPGLESGRALSALFGVVDFGLFVLLARQCRASGWACAFAFLAYGVEYTASTMRMYPLALAFILAGASLTLWAMRGGFAAAVAAGAAFGLGVLTHLLVAFIAAFVCGGAVLAARSWRLAAGIALGALPGVAWAASFYLVQDRRNEQFPPFTWLGMGINLAKQQGAAVLGGTPYYAPHALFLPLLVVLALLALGAVAVVATSLRPILARPEGWVLLAGAVAMPVSLVALGFAFDRVPVTSRYLAYSVPFEAMLLAIAVARPGSLRRAFAATFVAAQLVGALGLPFARVARQDARPSIAEIGRHWEPGAILLLPEAVDTTGMTAAWAYEAPPDWPLHLVTTDEPARRLRAVLAGRPEAFLSGQADGTGEEALARTRALLAQLGWRQEGPQGGARGHGGPAHLWFRYVPG